MTYWEAVWQYVMQRETAPQNYSVNTHTKMSIFNHQSIFGLTFKFCKSLLWNINYACVAQKQKKVKYWWHSRITSFADLNRAVTRRCVEVLESYNLTIHKLHITHIVHIIHIAHLTHNTHNKHFCTTQKKLLTHNTRSTDSRHNTQYTKNTKYTPHTQCT